MRFLGGASKALDYSLCALEFFIHWWWSVLEGFSTGGVAMQIELLALAGGEPPGGNFESASVSDRRCRYFAFRLRCGWFFLLTLSPGPTAAANHRFPPVGLVLVGSAMAAAVFTEVEPRAGGGGRWIESAAATATTTMMILQHCRHLGALLTHAF